MENRKIIHIDMDAFFASVEQRDHPELRGKPIAVGGSGGRGVVAAASYESRKFGVRSAMPSVTAKRLCPDLIFVPHRFEVYRAVSQKIREIFQEYTDLIEPLSLDEAYLDVTENKKHIPSGTVVAEQIRQRIFEETQLTASAGVSYCKFLAKIASDINKPNGLKVITPKEALPFLEALPIQKFYGIGKVTAKRMNEMDIFKGSDLKKLSEIEMGRHFGKSGRFYYKIVRGVDDRPVNPNRIRKSISSESTFNTDIDQWELLEEKILPLIEEVFTTLQEKNNYGRTITVKIKNAQFQTFTRSKTFGSDVKEAAIFKTTALQLLEDNYQQVGKIRLLGVGVSNLMSERDAVGVQLEFDF